MELRYGATFANHWNQNAAIVTSLSKFSRKMISRIVFDEGQRAKKYAGICTKLKAVSTVMGELRDSEVLAEIPIEEYKSIAQDYLKVLGNDVEIWEVLNEPNGDWAGDDVGKKGYEAWKIFKAAGKKTCITPYLFGPKDTPKGHEMFSWLEKNIPADMKLGLDYVMVSMYDDDNHNFGLMNDAEYVAYVQNMIDRLGVMFPNALLGIGECGTVNFWDKERMMNLYFDTIANGVKHPRWIFGGFWWYADMQQNGGKGDLVPYTNPLHAILNGIISKGSTTPSPVPTPVPAPPPKPTPTNYWSKIPLTDFKNMWGCAITAEKIHLKPKAATSKATINGESGPMPKETYSALAVLKYALPAGTKQRIRGKYIKQTRLNFTPIPDWECLWWCYYYLDKTVGQVFDKDMGYFAFKSKEIEAGVASKKLKQGFSGDIPYKGLKPGDMFEIEVGVSGNVASLKVNGEAVTFKNNSQVPFINKDGPVGPYAEDAELEIYTIERWV